MESDHLPTLPLSGRQEVQRKSKQPEVACPLEGPVRQLTCANYEEALLCRLIIINDIFAPNDADFGFKAIAWMAPI